MLRISSSLLFPKGRSSSVSFHLHCTYTCTYTRNIKAFTVSTRVKRDYRKTTWCLLPTYLPSHTFTLIFRYIFLLLLLLFPFSYWIPHWPIVTYSFNSFIKIFFFAITFGKKVFFLLLFFLLPEMNLKMGEKACCLLNY